MIMWWPPHLFKQVKQFGSDESWENKLWSAGGISLQLDILDAAVRGDHREGEIEKWVKWSRARKQGEPKKLA